MVRGCVVCVAAALLLGLARAAPAFGDIVGFHEGEARPISVVSELGQRLAARSLAGAAGGAGGAGAPDLRLPALPALPALPGLPSTQDLEAIKKVAQILIMLGEQVIPTILGDSGGAHALACDPPPPDEVPADPMGGDT